MKILNYGSLNLDYVYTVEHIVRQKETASSLALSIYPGGKGLNQSVALARAGCTVYHAGMTGEDGDMLLQTCRDNGVNTEYVDIVSGRNGHAIIQVEPGGENCILLFGGSNQANTKERVDRVLDHFEKGDIILLQNEVNLLDYMIEKSAGRGMRVVLNPSPYNERVSCCRLELVDTFLINEVEAGQITGENEPEEILKAMGERFPTAKTVLTLGGSGAWFLMDGEALFQPAFQVEAVDTTAAGDTFTGYFLQGYAGLLESGKKPESMDFVPVLARAARAAALAVSRKGAVPSIPYSKEL